MGVWVGVLVVGRACEVLIRRRSVPRFEVVVRVLLRLVPLAVDRPDQQVGHEADREHGDHGEQRGLVVAADKRARLPGRRGSR